MIFLKKIGRLLPEVGNYWLSLAADHLLQPISILLHYFKLQTIDGDHVQCWWIAILIDLSKEFAGQEAPGSPSQILLDCNWFDKDNC